MTHGSLFSGIGGFDIAAEWAGFENLFHCEWNPFCRKVLQHHFPNSESYEDITKTDFKKWRGKIDVLTGGFPCQPFSVAGSRRGAEDDRYLWPQMLRAIEEIRPDWVIGENVAGILTMVLPGEEIKVGGYADITGESYKEIETRQLYVVERICQDFECIGYSVQPVVIPACAVGAPHRRDRVWFVAENTIGIRCNRKIREKESGIRGFWKPCTRDYERIHSKENDSNELASNYILRRYERRSDETDGRREEKIGERIFCKAERLGKSRNASDTDNKRLSFICISERDAEKEQEIEKRCLMQSTGHDGITLPTDRWHDFPTQSPVCNRNDGISIGLAGISFSKWRQEAIKALGNAIVPQVAYEIFKAIKTITQNG